MSPVITIDDTSRKCNHNPIGILCVFVTARTVENAGLEEYLDGRILQILLGSNIGTVEHVNTPPVAHVKAETGKP